MNLRDAIKAKVAALDAAARPWAARSKWRGWAYEFLLFGLKQGWASLFGGIMLGLILVTKYFWPDDAALTRYDFLVVAAVLTQVSLLALKLEHWDEALVILIFHIVGTIMEIFKTAQGSWIYPEENILRIGGVPLFTGFMYACVGSYIARITRIFEVRFIHYPPIWTTWVLAILAYVNFFTHHYTIDIRYGLFAFSLLIFGRTWFTFTPDVKPRRMPLIVGALLVTFFIWVAENVGTFATAWVYPNQRDGWAIVSPEKMGSWYLLMLLSFVLVTAVRRPMPPDGVTAPYKSESGPGGTGRFL